MPKLSVILVIRNEAKKIRRCLESVRWADEIIVLDQSSTDNTPEICRQFTAQVFVVPAKDFCEPDRLAAAARTANDWVLYIDADEEVPIELKSEILSLLLEEPQHGNYYVQRRNIFLGKWIKGSGWHPNYLLRLFKKGSVRFSEDIHTCIVPISSSCGYLKQYILHYTCEDIGEYLLKANRYTSVLANQAYKKGQRVNPLNFIFKLLILPLAAFFYKYIFKIGFRDGLQGLWVAFFTFLTIFMMNAKLWTMQNKAKQ